MSVLEAMAAGVPVIGTRVDGITDLVQDGVTGLLAAPGDAEDLAQGLKRIINREIDVQTLRVAAHCKQVERYSDRSMAAAIAAIYDAILEPSMSRNPSHTLTNPVGSHTPCAVRTAPCGFDNPAADGARTMAAPLQEAVP